MDQWGTTDEVLQFDTPYGSPSGPVNVFVRGNSRLLFLARHGPGHTIPPHRVNYRANLWALKEAGAAKIIAINAVGGITESFGPGVLAVPDQLIDYTWGRTHTYSDDAEHRLQHVDFTMPFDGVLRQQLLQAGVKAGLDLREKACLAVTQGPRLETAAEILRLKNDGCDLVGMTSMPEAALARELALPYATLAAVANLAAGIGEDVISQQDMHQTLNAAMGNVRRLLTEFLSD